MSEDFIFYLYCAITVIIQCLVLHKAIITKNEHIWCFFWCIFLGMISSSITGIFLTNSFDPDFTYFSGLNDLFYLFSSGIMITIGFIVMIIGFNIKLKLNKHTPNKLVNSSQLTKLKLLIITNIIMISIVSLILIIPYQIRLHNFKELEIYSSKYLKNYLDNEYGKGTYEIIRFERDYNYNGIISSSFIGFEATIQLYNMNNYFSVYVEGTNKNELRIEDEIINRKNLNLAPLN